MAGFDPNEEWLGHVQPVGLVVAPLVLKAYDIVPEQQTRSQTEAVKAYLSQTESGPALLDPWQFFANILGWRADRTAGSPGGAPIPEELILRIEESDIGIAPHWAVADPDGGWQMLVRIEAAGVDPDGRGVLEGWEATPHQRLERLCKDRQVRTGILVTDGELRLIHALRGETSGWLRFPLRSLGEVGGRPMLGGLKLLLSSFRLHNDAPERRLPALLQKSRDEQAEVSTKLAAQVLGALHELLRGLHDADRARMERLAREQPEHVYDGLLTVLLRLVFLLYAEDRELIPSRTDAEARRLYDQGYGVRTLHARLTEDRARHELTMHLRRGAWARLLALFRLVHQGDRSGDWIRGRGGKLFDPAAFPFLQGQDDPNDSPEPAEVSDECVAKVLDRLLVLSGEKLSYRTLDVEQIGSVYETVMGFTMETMDGPALAIRAGKHDRTPVFVDLKRLLATNPNDRAKFLKEEADRGKVTDRVGEALNKAATIEELVASLTPIVDERASPGAAIAAPGTPLLQPTDERRRTGSHYTPRSLTAPIVRHALKPAFQRIGADATPENVLSLKVCDPAMGSGAFLVEACRALGERLVLAWARWPQKRPVIPPDEDEELHARRLVTQRSLYGIDKNPRAVDLAKLSLWLATLARDHEFTFLDHALRCGDSLVGLTTEQIAASNWNVSKRSLPLFRQLVSDKVTKLMQGRAEIQNAPDDTVRAIQERRHRDLEAEVAPIRLIGDAVVSAFFAADKAKSREKARADIESHISGISQRSDLLQAASERLRAGARGVVPFHWQVEFPEVFARHNGGFDAIIGNPPFLGGAKIWPTFGGPYVDWLKFTHADTGGKGVNLVAHFLRQAMLLLRPGGAFGLIATNTVAQGDTRNAGLRKLCADGGTIYRVTRKFRWPGDAAVVVSVLHLVKSSSSPQPVIDNKPVGAINSMLLPTGIEMDPAPLLSNTGLCFRGCDTYGTGFIFTESGGAQSAGSIKEMDEIIARNPRNAERIQPFIGGRELSNHPRHQHNRYAINFEDMRLNEAEGWPELLDIVRERVKPARDKLGGYSVAERRREFWWQYGTYTPSLFRSISQLDQVCATGAAAAMHHMISLVSANQIFSHKVIVFSSQSTAFFATIQSSIHESWSRTFGTTFGSSDALTYNPLRVLRTFPFPSNLENCDALRKAGADYNDFRSNIMIERNEGLTSIYNRFHDSREAAADIARLRSLHHEMDVVVLRAYGWRDLADSATPDFIEQEADEGKAPKTRFDWPVEFKDEVLARLLAVNAERARAEREAGLTMAAEVNETEEEDA